MRPSDILERISALRDEYKDSDDQHILDGWVKTVEEAELKITLLERKEIGNLLLELASRIGQARRILATNPGLTEAKRIELFATIEVLQGVIDWFTGAYGKIEAIAKFVDSKIKS